MSDRLRKPMLMVMETAPGLVNFTRPGEGASEATAQESAQAEMALDVGKTLMGVASFGLLGLFVPAWPAIGMAAAAAKKADAAKAGEPKAQPVDSQAQQVGEAFLRAGGLEVVGLMDAMSGNYVFPPGHPFPGLLYQLHPLARARVEKSNVYVPVAEFDDVLFKEREAELIRLLAVLGASRIELRDTVNSRRSTQGRVVAGAAGKGGAAEAEHKATDTQMDSRIFELRGKHWSPKFVFDRKEFGWLEFEPAWDALAFARVDGGCTTATIELTKRSTFSLSASIAVQAAVVKGEASGSHSHDRDESKLVSAHFPGSLDDPN